MDLAGEILKIVVTGLLAGVSTLAIGHFFDRKPKAVHSAIRVATVLERFTLECSDAAGENKLFIDSEGDAGQPKRLPDAPAYSGSIVWSVLDQNLAERALSFENQIHTSAQFIAHVRQFESGPEDDGWITATANECGRLGLVAWSIASDIRSFYKLPKVKVASIRHNVAEYLRPFADAASKDDKARNTI